MPPCWPLSWPRTDLRFGCPGRALLGPIGQRRRYAAIAASRRPRPARRPIVHPTLARGRSRLRRRGALAHRSRRRRRLAATPGDDLWGNDAASWKLAAAPAPVEFATAPPRRSPAGMSSTTTGVRRPRSAGRRVGRRRDRHRQAGAVARPDGHVRQLHQLQSAASTASWSTSPAWPMPPTSTTRPTSSSRSATTTIPPAGPLPRRPRRSPFGPAWATMARTASP